MIRILNCFKTAPDLDKVPEAEWASGATAGAFDFSYIRQEIDPYSESGLELTLRAVRNAPGQELHTAALTVGGPVSEKALRTLYALGFDRCVRAESFAAPFDAEGTASLIASFCQGQDDPFDLIILGTQSPDGGTQKTPYLLAEHLGLPLLSQVTGFDFTGNRLRVTRKVTGGILTETVSLPLIITIGDVPGALLHVPTLMQRKKSAGKTIEMLDESPAQWEKPVISLTGMEPVDQSRHGEHLTGKDAAEIAQIIFDRYFK